MDRSLLERFYRGEVSDEEAQKVINWLNSEEAEKEIESDAETYFNGNSHKKIIWNAEKLLQSIRYQLTGRSGPGKADAFKVSKPVELKKRNSYSWKIAAAIIIFLIPTITFLTYSFLAKDAKPVVIASMISKHASKGQKLSIYLPDGTKVILNSDSEIQYPAEFGRQQRDVNIIGEAFFEVTKDPSRPFIVHTPFFQTVVLGTSFNVSAKPDCENSTVSLKTGKILVKTIGSDLQAHEGVYLVPGEMLTINSKNNLSEISNFDEELVFGWTRNTLAFKNEPLEFVFGRLETWYGVEFSFNQNYKAKKGNLYSGRFENESLENVLNGLAYVQDFEYKIIDKSVEIKFN